LQFCIRAEGADALPACLWIDEFLILLDYYFCFDFFGVFFAVASVGWQD
jgi:hypothetical protein